MVEPLFSLGQSVPRVTMPGFITGLNIITFFPFLCDLTCYQEEWLNVVEEL